ncbi:MAG: sigma-E factor negative regulatory protein [Caldimonas sp.]
MSIDGVEDSSRERLSALVDGELDSAGAAASCGGWAQNQELRGDWHAWHLIGDVLRSDDLAADPARDRRFCAGVRLRLEKEPVVLAPSAMPAAAVGRLVGNGQRRPWRAAGAVAAGVVLVVGTFAIVRPWDAPVSPRLAVGDAPAVSAVAAAPVVPVQVQPEMVLADGRLIRDAQLDRYLEAHKQFAGTSALGVPSAFLRSATVDSAAR